jgi:hypothetical protein
VDERVETSNGEGLVQLAATLEADPWSVLRALGGGWRRVEVQGEGWPVHPWTSATWFATGEPLQVLAGVDHAALVLARPVISWSGHQPVIGVADTRVFAREDVHFQAELVAAAVEELARRSRQRFRWCRTCHTVNAPAHMHDREDCQACASTYRGVVF